MENLKFYPPLKVMPESPVVSRCKKSSSRYIGWLLPELLHGRCFRVSNEVKWRGEKNAECRNQMVFIRQIVYSHYKRPFRWSTLLLTLSLSLSRSTLPHPSFLFHRPYPSLPRLSLSTSSPVSPQILSPDILCPYILIHHIMYTVWHTPATVGANGTSRGQSF